jgi:ABC-type Fe3+/spermidine/putrescine transport system ATPase subunit
VARGLSPAAGDNVTICLRPEKIAMLGDTAPAPGVVTAQAQVIDTLVIGPLTRITLDAQGTRMTSIQMTDALGPVTPGATVRIGFPADAARVFAPLTADLATAFGDHA